MVKNVQKKVIKWEKLWQKFDMEKIAQSITCQIVVIYCIIKSQVLKQNRHSPYKYWFVAISLYSVTENISGKLKKILVMQDSLDLLACTVSVIQFHVKNLSHVFQYFIIISKLVSVCIHWDTAVFF